MRRSALKRRVGLRRGGWLRRKPVGVIAAGIWREDLGVCVVCELEDAGCSGRVQGHHIVAKQTLRRAGLADFVMDKRNRLPVCEHRHEQHTTGYKPIPRSALPASVFEFAAELGLGWYLDRHYPAQEEAALSRGEAASASLPESACPSPGCPRTLTLDPATRVLRCSEHGPMELAA